MPDNYPSPQPVLEAYQKCTTIQELDMVHLKFHKLIKIWTDNLDEYNGEYLNARNAYKHYKKRLLND